ncbi:MAG TPA: hypothetical protein VFQ07_01995 [Candidatus Polarisedimenticolia bacterium]|nr:hypothetical protein [Candidatus Polarisedimenticolia bacterium]
MSARPGFTRVWLVALGIMVTLAAASSSAEATTYYFSNCATGGAGTQSNPYCLDPAGIGKKISFAYLMDGQAPEVAAGDTIALCAGACDGTGSATYGLDPTGTTSQNSYSYVFSPRVSGTAAAPITITAFAGESVVLSGDTNQDGIPQASEPQVMLTDTTGTGANKAYYVIKNLTFEKVSQIMFYLNNNPANWTFDNVEVRYSTTEMWNGGNIADNGCDNEHGGYVFKLADLQGPLVIKNSRFHHICGAVHRHTVNQSTSGSVLSENNEYYNVSVVTNNFQGRNETWRGNYIHDFVDGITIEEDMKDIVIEDNIVACPGDYKTYSDGRCGRAIHISDGDNGPASAGKTKNITIRRNKIYGRVDGQFGNSASTNWGYFLCALRVTATNNTGPINILIENNMIWHHLSWSSDSTCSAGIGINTNRSEVTIQNNTVYDSANGIGLDATVPGIAYTVRDNLLIRANKGGNKPEMVIAANASGSIVRNNNLNSDGQGDPVMTVAGTNYGCSQMASYQTGNKCAATTFVRTTGAVKDWDLHLPATDTANRNAGMAGATEDIDKAPRGPVPIDIGADEVGAGGLSATVGVTSGGQAVPSLNGAYLLKAGTYTVTLTTSSSVISVPGALTLTTSGGGTVLVPLAGSIPGTLFTGSLTVGTGTAEGNATFSLPAATLDDGQGNRGQAITNGSLVVVDVTPPAAPTGVRTQ